MIKPFTKALTLILISAAMLTACKKDKEDTLAVNQENLTGTYTLGAMKMKVGNVESDVTQDFVDACNRDDQFILRDDNEFEYVDAGTKCTDDDSYIGEWFLENNVLYTDEFSGTIDKLTNKQLVLKETEDIGGGQTATYTIILNRK